jgi:hypothetical protein
MAKGISTEKYNIKKVHFLNLVVIYIFCVAMTAMALMALG